MQAKFRHRWLNLESAQDEYCKHDQLVYVHLGKTPQQWRDTLVQLGQFFPTSRHPENEQRMFACSTSSSSPNIFNVA